MSSTTSKRPSLGLLNHERIVRVRPFIPLRYFKRPNPNYVTFSFSERFKKRVLSLAGHKSSIHDADFSLFVIEKAMNDSALGKQYGNPVMFSLNDFFSITKHLIKNDGFYRRMKVDHLMYVKLNKTDAVVVTVQCRRNHYEFDCFELNERKNPVGIFLIAPTINGSL